MSRSLWFVAGAGAGVYAVVRARRVAEALTPEGLRDRWGALTLGARMMRDEVVTGAAERETELRQRYGLVPDGRPQLASGVSTGSTGGRGSTGSTGEMGSTGGRVSTGSTGGRVSTGSTGEMGETGSTSDRHDHHPEGDRDGHR